MTSAGKEKKSSGGIESTRVRVPWGSGAVSLSHFRDRTKKHLSLFHNLAQNLTSFLFCLNKVFCENWCLILTLTLEKKKGNARRQALVWESSKFYCVSMRVTKIRSRAQQWKRFCSCFDWADFRALSKVSNQPQMSHFGHYVNFNLFLTFVRSWYHVTIWAWAQMYGPVRCEIEVWWFSVRYLPVEYIIYVLLLCERKRNRSERNRP